MNKRDKKDIAIISSLGKIKNGSGEQHVSSAGFPTPTSLASAARITFLFLQLLPGRVGDEPLSHFARNGDSQTHVPSHFSGSVRIGGRFPGRRTPCIISISTVCIIAYAGNFLHCALSAVVSSLQCGQYNAFANPRCFRERTCRT